ASPGRPTTKRTMTMDRKGLIRLALGAIAAGLAVMMMPTVAFAQEAAEKGTFLTSNGAAWLGGAIGAGLAIMGGAAGIGRIRGPAVGVDGAAAGGARAVVLPQ